MNILLIEDHDLLRQTIRITLEKNGYLVDAFGSAEDIVENVTSLWKVAILDINLPGEDGYSLARRLRQSYPELFIIMLTVRNRTEDKIHGYETGADIYLGKPIDINEMLAILLAFKRRVHGEKSIQGYYLDVAANIIKNDRGLSIKLTSKEALVLKSFVLAKDNLLETWQLKSMLGTLDDERKNQIEVFISRLRKKLAEVSDEQKAIITHRSIGYQLTLSFNLC